jgi:hypothetical protein
MTTYQLPERVYGDRAQQTRDMRVKDLAPIIRKEIRELIPTEHRGKGPEQITVSVRYEVAGWTPAIRVTIVLPDHIWELCEQFETEHGRLERQSDEWFVGKYEPLRKIVHLYKTARDIHGSFNHNGSDAMVDYFDVRFYGHVDLIQRTRYERWYK